MVKGHHNVKNCHNKLEMHLNDAVYNNLTTKSQYTMFLIETFEKSEFGSRNWCKN